MFEILQMCILCIIFYFFFFFVLFFWPLSLCQDFKADFPLQILDMLVVNREYLPIITLFKGIFTVFLQ